HERRGESGKSHEVIHQNRRRSKERDDPVALRFTGLRRSRQGTLRLAGGTGCGLSEHRAQRRDHVRCLGDQPGTLFEKAVGPFAAGVERGPWDRKHLAPLFQEMSRYLLNITKRSLPRLTLRGVGLTIKNS